MKSKLSAALAAICLVTASLGAARADTVYDVDLSFDLGPFGISSLTGTITENTANNIVAFHLVVTVADVTATMDSLTGGNATLVGNGLSSSPTQLTYDFSGVGHLFHEATDDGILFFFTHRLTFGFGPPRFGFAAASLLCASLRYALHHRASRTRATPIVPIRQCLH